MRSILLLTMVYNECCHVICMCIPRKNCLLCTSDQLSKSAFFQELNIGYCISAPLCDDDIKFLILHIIPSCLLSFDSGE